MSIWRATKAKRVYAAPIRNGWTLKNQVGSHRKLARTGSSNFIFCFHDHEEVGPAALGRIAKDTGLRPEDI
jgi:predicted RNA binding protein YcfA (HicA-like mRNA interferase family)